MGQADSRGRVLIYDAAPLVTEGLDKSAKYYNTMAQTSWKVGAGLFGRHFAAVIPATSWKHAAQALRQYYDAHGAIKEVQYWGHGCSGAAVIGSDYMMEHTLDTPEFKALEGCFEANGLWWWRTCSTHSGPAGRRFAEALARRYRVRVAGHTKDISRNFPFTNQPGLVVLKLRIKTDGSVDEASFAAQWADDEAGQDASALAMTHSLLH